MYSGASENLSEIETILFGNDRIALVGMGIKETSKRSTKRMFNIMEWKYGKRGNEPVFVRKWSIRPNTSCKNVQQKNASAMWSLNVGDEEFSCCFRFSFKSFYFYYV